RYGAEQNARDDGDLGRTATHPAEQTDRQVDEIFPGLRRLEEGRKGHEQDDELRRGRRRHAEDPLHAVDEGEEQVDLVAAVVEDSGQPRAHEDIGDEDQADDRQGQPRRSAGDLDHQDGADRGDDRVHLGRQHAGTADQLVDVQPDIGTAGERQQDG
ncbi:Uncharacterized protein APZ42_003102, partial [Daphnia magna]